MVLVPQIPAAASRMIWLCCGFLLVLFCGAFLWFYSYKCLVCLGGWRVASLVCSWCFLFLFVLFVLYCLSHLLRRGTTWLRIHLASGSRYFVSFLSLVFPCNSYYFSGYLFSFLFIYFFFSFSFFSFVVFRFFFVSFNVSGLLPCLCCTLSYIQYDGMA